MKLVYQIRKNDDRIYHWYNDFSSIPFSAPQSAFLDYFTRYNYKYLKHLNWVGPVHTMIFWKHLQTSFLK